MDKLNHERPRPMRKLALRAVTTIGFAAGALMSTHGPASAASVCTSDVKGEITEAKQDFARSCGRGWDDQQRDKCVWTPKGWFCHEHSDGEVPAPTSASDVSGEPRPREAVEEDAAAQALPRPSFISVGDAGAYVSVIWRHHQTYRGVNLYRNGDFVASINASSGNVYNDFQGKAGDTYYLIAYDGNDGFSDRSAEKSAVGELRNVSSEGDLNGGITLRWTADYGVRYRIYRLGAGERVEPGRGTLLGTTVPSGNNYRDGQAIVGGVYVIQGVRPDGTVMPLVEVRPDYGAVAELAARQACRVCRVPPTPPPGVEPPDNPATNIPGVDPSADGRTQSLLDLVRFVSERASATADGVDDYFEQFRPERVTVDDLAERATAGIEDDGYRPRGGSGTVFDRPDGSTAEIRTEGSTVIENRVHPSWQNPARPGLVEVIETTTNDDGSVTQTRTTVAYSYDMMGEPIAASVTITEQGERPRTTRTPSSGGSGGGDGDGGGGGGINYETLDDKGTTDPPGSQNCGSNGCP